MLRYVLTTQIVYVDKYMYCIHICTHKKEQSSQKRTKDEENYNWWMEEDQPTKKTQNIPTANLT